jgi:hypothetical protein
MHMSQSFRLFLSEISGGVRTPRKDKYIEAHDFTCSNTNLQIRDTHVSGTRCPEKSFNGSVTRAGPGGYDYWTQCIKIYLANRR